MSYWWTPMNIYPSQITHNDVDDSYPMVSGSRIVWTTAQGGVWAYSVAWPYDPSPLQVANNGSTIGACISDGQIVWSAAGGSGEPTTDSEVWTWRPGEYEPTQVTINGVPDRWALVSEGRIAWIGAGGVGADVSDLEIWTTTSSIDRPGTAVVVGVVIPPSLTFSLAAERRHPAVSSRLRRLTSVL